MTHVRYLCLVIGLSMLGLPVASAQLPGEEGSEPTYWVRGGPTMTTLGPGVSGGIALEFDRHVLSLRTVSTDPNWGGETWDVAFLYGRATSSEHFFLSAGVGASIIGGQRYSHLFGGGEGEELDPMIGFPLEGQVMWTPTRLVSLGMYAFANVNTGHPFGGLGFELRLGKLR